MKAMIVFIGSKASTHNNAKVGDILTLNQDGPRSFEVVGGSLRGYAVNPDELDEDLTIRIGHRQDDIIYVVRPVSKASQRKLLVRALKVIARHRGYTDAYVRKFGECANVGDWARKWADWYFAIAKASSYPSPRTGSTARNTNRATATNGTNSLKPSSILTNSTFC